MHLRKKYGSQEYQRARRKEFSQEPIHEGLRETDDRRPGGRMRTGAMGLRETEKKRETGWFP